MYRCSIRSRVVKLIAFVAIVAMVANESHSYAQTNAVPSLEDLAGTWQIASQLRSFPAMNSTQGSAQTVNDLLAVGKLSFPPITMNGTTGSLFVNGEKPKLDKTRWYAYQVLRKGYGQDIRIETSTRMLDEQRGLLFHVLLTNTTSMRKTFHVAIALQALTGRHARWGWKIPRDVDSTAYTVMTMDDGSSFMLQDSVDRLSNCFSFEQKPDRIHAGKNSGQAIWNVTIPPKGTKVINYALVMGENSNDVHNLALNSSEHFDSVFRQVKTDWEEHWMAMFTTKNQYFSGHVPVLITPDKKMRRIYYISLVSLLSVYRTCFPIAKRVYVSNTPESNCTMMYFWDTREWATTLALLDPVMMKEYLTSWLAKGIYRGYAEEYLTGTLQGVWYSANDYSIFILLNDYLNVTGDRAFLSDTIEGVTVLAHMDSIATHWKSLVQPGQTLADYGGAENLLECVPTYINEVASFNAANVWMMRRVAALERAEGDTARATYHTDQANQLLPAVLNLYIPGQGVWYALHDDGTKIQIRHVFDFATIGLTIPNDLSSTMKNQMVGFVERELITDHWMRAQSLSDPAASVSDRPDHGPMGAFCAWPPETIAAMCEFEKFGKALNFLHRCTATTYEGPFSQSRELMGKTPDAPVKINERGSGGLPTQTYNASNGVGFAETIIREFFGYKPDILTHTIVPVRLPRGFEGKLLNVRQDDHLYKIISDARGIHVQSLK
jgi:hypothetical protein